MPSTLVRNVSVGVDGRHRCDVLLADGVVARIDATGGRRVGADIVVDGAGSAVLPGLTDHHLHLHATAAAEASVPCGPPRVRSPDEMRAALGRARGDADGWVRGVGYFESVAGELNSRSLDALHSERPVRVQHRSGAMWVVNSSAARHLDLDGGDHPGIERDPAGRPTGRLWRADSWLREHLPAGTPPSLTDLGRLLARHGVTAVTDATPDLSDSTVRALVEAAVSGELPQRLQLLGVPLGNRVDVPGRVSTGPFKIVLADSDLPGLDTVARAIAAAHDADRAVAVHCVTREALVVLLAAFDDVGTRSGDRIEHASLVPADCLDTVRDLGLTVVTQPGFVADRGDDFLAHVAVSEHVDLYRCRSLVDHGVPMALSSDAPYGPLSPWAVIDAAHRRRTPAGVIASEDERIDRTRALSAYLGGPDRPGGPPTELRVGRPADLILLRGNVVDAVAGPDPVAMTWIDGHLVHDGR